MTTVRGRRLSDDEFRQLIDDAKASHRLSDIIGRRTTLRKRGRSELVGLCVFHKERSPSLEVNDAKGFYHCHGCGASGDHFRFLREADGLTFRQAYEALTNDTFPIVSAAERAAAAAEDAELRAKAISDAEALWRDCVSIEGTPGETYLRQVRGISVAIPPTIRFGFVPTSRDEHGAWKRPYPAVVCACTGADGSIRGLQRIFLRDDGREKRWGKKSKLSLGRPRGAAVRLGPPASEVVICEGPEDGLSLAEGLPGKSVWIALGTAMMPEMEMPPGVGAVVVAGQNDAAGRLAVERAAAALAVRGLGVRTMFPDAAFKDWNDQLRGAA